MPPHDAVTKLQPLTVIFYGIQGSGKGTQAKLLKEYLATQDRARGAVLVGMGDLFRNYLATHDTYFAQRIKAGIARGELLPELVAAHVLTGCIANHMDITSNLIVEGAGRTLNQAELLDQLLVWVDRPTYQVVLLELSRESAIARLQARGRSDEATLDQIESRLDAYERDTLPAIELLEQKGHIVHRIHAEASIDEIHQHILSAVGFNKN